MELPGQIEQHEESHSHESHSHGNFEIAGQEGKTRRKIVKGLIIAGMLALLLFVSVVVVRFVPRFLSDTSSYFANLGGSKNLVVAVEPKEVISDNNFTITWKNNTSDKTGDYTFGYKCTEGVSVFYKTADGKESPVICETSFPLPSGANSYEFRATSTTTDTTLLPVNVSLWDPETRKQKLSANSEVPVLPKGAKVDTQAPATSKTSGSPTSLYPSYDSYQGSNQGSYQGSYQTSTSTSQGAYTYGASQTTVVTKPYSQTAQTPAKSDLSLSLVKVGYLDYRGNLIQSMNIPQGSRVLVTFRVSNTGGRSPLWKITATLPTSAASDRYYTSIQEPSLAAGASYEMHMVFGPYDSALGSAVITLVSSGDTNSSNNSITVPLAGTVPPYGYGYNFTYPGNTYNYGYTGYTYYPPYDYGYGYNTSADLSVKITKVGSVIGSNEQFYEDSSITKSEKAAVQFEVTNNGNAESGPWTYTVIFPTYGSDMYTSATQDSLQAGGRASITAKFENPVPGDQVFFVTVQSQYDSNSYNNSDTKGITVTN